MKKLLICGLLVSTVAASVVGCGNKTEEVDNSNNVEISENQTTEDAETSEESENASKVDEIMAGILALDAVPMPMEISDEDASTIYHLDLETVEDYSMTVCGRSPGVGLVVLAQAKEGQVDSVKASVEAILADKVAQAFYPDEQDIYRNAKVEVNGNLVSLVVVDETVKAEVEEYFNSQIAE